MPQGPEFTVCAWHSRQGFDKQHVCKTRCPFRAQPNTPACLHWPAEQAPGWVTTQVVSQPVYARRPQRQGRSLWMASILSSWEERWFPLTGPRELVSPRAHSVLIQKFLQCLLGSLFDHGYNPEPREVSTSLVSSSVKWEMYTFKLLHTPHAPYNLIFIANQWDV